MKANLLSSFLATSAVLLASSLADGLIVIHNPPPGSGRPHHPVFAPLEVVYHNVEVAIDGQQATTEVDQEFYNPNNATLEGEYLFPIPEGAHIDGFTMRVGDQDLEAELLDAEKARQVYEDIVRRQKDPALLEYTGRGAFRVRIFPIEPRSGKKVSLRYTELLSADSGMVSYLYPLNTEKFSAQPLEKVAIKVALVQPSPIKALYSPSHEVEVRRDGGRRATVGFEESGTRPDRDFQLFFSTAESDVGISLLTHREGGGEDGYFTLLASPGAAAEDGAKPNPKDVVFVLDTSGSMAGAKLAQAKKALAFCIENLNDDDRFEVVRFSTESEPCFDRLTTARRADRDRALEWVDRFKPIGGTAIHDALGRAQGFAPDDNDRPFVVVFLTDGQPTVGETDEDRIVASVADGAGHRRQVPRIFCFGIGTDVNSHLLDKIVERTRAASQFVLPDEDLELKVSSFFTKIKEPLLTGIRIVWPEGVRVSHSYPHPLPDLFRGDQLVVTGRYHGSGQGEIVLEGTLNGEPRRLAAMARFPKKPGGTAFVPQLWATRRVGWLLDEIRLRGESDELRDEVVELARRYAIVSPYTSYLIVEDEARRNVPVARRSLQELDRNAGAQELLRGRWAEIPTAKAGPQGTRNALSNQKLKLAESLGGAEAASTTDALEAIAGAGADSRHQLAAVAQEARRVGNKSFFQNGATWIDPDAQRLAPENATRITFASDEYFALSRRSQAAQWLALARNVEFALEGTLYQIID